MQVTQIRTAVAEGRYEVDSFKVADAIVEKLRAVGAARDFISVRADAQSRRFAAG